MIIFGTTARRKTIGSGQFYCPHCQTQRSYERKQAKRYFTLYFIPLIPMGDLGEFIECQTCHMAFSVDVLKLKPSVKKLSLAEMMNRVKGLLDDGMPVEYLIRDLTAAGLDREVALQTVNTHLGEARKHCPDCGLTYSPAIATCTECGKPLESNAK